jgi:hypothetical protein
MANLGWTIIPMSDAEVLTAFGRIAQSVGSGAATFTVTIHEGGNLDPVKGNIADLGEKNPFGGQLSTLLIGREFHLQTPDVPKFSVVLSRNTTGELKGVDSVRVSFQDGTAPERVLELVGAVKSVFLQYDLSGNLDRALGPALAEFHKLREASLLRLEESQVRLTELTVVHRKALDEEASAARQKLTEEFATRDERYNAAMKVREEALAAKGAELDRLREELDDKTSTHARRQLRRDLLEKLKAGTTFELSKQTQQKRWPVHIAFGMMIGVALLALSTSVEHATTAAAGDWFSHVRLLLSAIAFAGAGIFYVRWNDDWARRHAAEELRLGRLSLDVDRASWVVEMLLEWKGEKEGALPPSDLLRALVTGLFQDSDSSSDGVVRHPVEDMASRVLGAASALELSVGGNRITLDKKGLEQLGRGG